MIPSISSSFIPTEVYVIISILLLLSIIIYFIRIQSDINFTKENSITVNSTPFYISFIVSILSLISLFLPAIEIPFLGGVSFVGLASNLDDDMIYLLPLFISHIFIIIFSGIVSIKKLSFKSAKTENLDLLFAILVLFIDLLVLVELIGRTHPTGESDNFIVNTITESFSLGLGVYLLLSLSFIQLLLAIFSNKFSSKSIISTKLNNEALNVSELRELKKLLDEGVITQEEFENRKKKLL